MHAPRSVVGLPIVVPGLLLSVGIHYIALHYVPLTVGWLIIHTSPVHLGPHRCPYSVANRAASGSIACTRDVDLPKLLLNIELKTGSEAPLKIGDEMWSKRVFAINFVLIEVVVN